MAEVELVQSVTKGVIEQTKSNTEKKTNELGKDAFLQLLTTQMKYQDPLNPNTDTEYIAQLATFSQLEQMQNISALTTNSQAFSLVGKNVIVKTQSTNGNLNYISGTVDFVNMSGGKAKISVNGNLYDIDQLDSVIDETYIIEQGLPKVTTKTELKYNAANPKDASFEVNLGSGETVASKVAIAINNQVVDSKLVSVSGNKVTIKKEAFEGLENGVYKITVVFDDVLYTTVKDMVTLKVENAAPKDDNNDNEDDGATGPDYVNNDGGSDVTDPDNDTNTDGTADQGKVNSGEA